MDQTDKQAVRIISASASDARVPFEDGFLAGDLDQLAGLRLAGSRCTACGIALWGVRRRCENCSSPEVNAESFEQGGTVHTFTVQRYAPPKPHSLSGPWEPRPVAWVDLDGQGPRVLAPVRCAPDDMTIGMRVRLHCEVGHVDGEGREVVTYVFTPEEAA